MGKSKIEWTEQVWNPVTGCTKVSAGCRNCYAERMAKRLAHIPHSGYGGGTTKPDTTNAFSVTLRPERLEEPAKWKKPNRIFVCSMGDLFHKDVPFGYVDKVMNTMRNAPQHTFLVLTKRAGQMKEYFEQIGKVDNLWLGVSVENQATADERIPLLIQTPAAKRFVSYEPALGAVNFERWLFNPTPKMEADGILHWDLRTARQFDWLIMGGESGPKARPLHPDWVRSTRDQCKTAGVPFFFKQWGEYKYFSDGTGEWEKRVGKKAAGCLIDEKEWKEIPAGVRKRGAVR